MWTLRRLRRPRRAQSDPTPSRLAVWWSSLFQDSQGAQAAPAPTSVCGEDLSELDAPDTEARWLDPMQRLLDDLPPHIRVRHAVKHAPDILRHIGMVMDQPLRLQRIFDEVLLEQKGGGPKLPFAVMAELSDIKHHLMLTRGVGLMHVWMLQEPRLRDRRE